MVEQRNSCREDTEQAGRFCGAVPQVSDVLTEASPTDSKSSAKSAWGRVGTADVLTPNHGVSILSKLFSGPRDSLEFRNARKVLRDI